MRRLDVDVLFGRGIDPFSFRFTAREYERVDSMIVHYADLKVGVRWRARNAQPFVRQRINMRHNSRPPQSVLDLRINETDAP